MELGGMVEQLKNKCILITGSTGFLAKIFVEKVLRIQPNVKKLILLVRTSDSKSAMQRMQNEVVATQLFDVLREKHGQEFDSFITEKLAPISGDIALANLGIQNAGLREELQNEISLVVNVAATTNFYNRYDVSLNINVLGAKHVLEFAKRCPKLEMLLHVSTAYVAREMEGLITEKPVHMSKTNEGNKTILDNIEAELKLVEERKTELHAGNSPNDVVKTAMKELGLKRAKKFGWPNTYVFTKAMGEMLLGKQRENVPLVILRPTIITSTYKEPFPGWVEGIRTIDSFIIGYVKGNPPCMFFNPISIVDVIPGDMVVNSMIVAMITHMNQHFQFIYQICSSTQNPVKFTALENSTYNFFLKNPRMGKNGKPIKTRRIPVFENMAYFRGYMALRYKLPLEVLHLVNVALCQSLSRKYSELSRGYKYAMRLADIYEPYAFFRGCFDDTNAESLRMTMARDFNNEAKILDFSPKHFDWEDYLSTVHIPGVLKYACK